MEKLSLSAEGKIETCIEGYCRVWPKSIARILIISRPGTPFINVTMSIVVVLQLASHFPSHSELPPPSNPLAKSKTLSYFTVTCPQARQDYFVQEGRGYAKCSMQNSRISRANQS
jgi:hypothetical protein